MTSVVPRAELGVETTPSKSSGPRGALAGAASALVFTFVHQLTISNIWAMLGPMVVAGALCGLCIAWTYGRFFGSYTIGTWVGYNAIYLAMFAALAAVSVVVFEPVTTMAALINRGGPVDDLIGQALPFTGGFTLVTAGGLGVMLARTPSDYLRFLLTVTTLMLFLGLNVSVLGLVDFGGSSLAPVVAFFALIVLLDAVFVVCFAVLRRANRLARNPASQSGRLQNQLSE